MRWLAVAALVLVSGCLGQAPGEVEAPQAPPGGSGPDATNLPAFDCAHANVEVGAACLQRIQDQQRSLQEPVLAISPLAATTWVLGTQAGELAPTPGESSGALAPRGAILVSTDSGASWTLRPMPAMHVGMAVGLPAFSDPTMAFDATGVLHVVGMSTDVYRANGFSIVHTSTPDLGQTWTPAVRISEDGDLDNDRPWLAYLDGTLVITWQNQVSTGWTTQAAWSTDGGASWRQQTAAQAASMCSHASPAVLHAGRVLYACAHYEGSDSKLGIAIHELDVETGDSPRTALVDGVKGWWPRLAIDDGAIRLVADTEDGQAAGSTILLSSSLDSRTWTPPINVGDLMKVDQGWDAMRHYAFAASGGLVYLTVNGAIPTPGSATFQDHRAQVVVDPARSTVVLEQDLWPAIYTATPSASIGWSDDWGEAIRVADGVVMVMGHERGLEIARFTS